MTNKQIIIILFDFEIVEKINEKKDIPISIKDYKQNLFG